MLAVLLTAAREKAYTGRTCAYSRRMHLGSCRMARIRHIAIATDDPANTAEFYKQFFGLTELYRQPGDTGAKGVWLSDGYIYFAVLKYGEPGVPKLGPGQTSELRGIHHIGFQVDDQEATAKALREANVSPVPIAKSGDPQESPMAEISRAANLKFLGPDAVQFDVRSRGWNEAISFGMQRYELTPVVEEQPE
jgi:catechol 2,3-dioxygenase-like lactoylglutathione lyase family enzyme